MGLFGKNKISSNDSFSQAVQKKADNKNLSTKSISKLTYKLNSITTVDEVQTAMRSLNGFKNEQVKERINKLINNNKNATNIVDQAIVKKTVQQFITRGISPSPEDIETYKELTQTLAKESRSNLDLKNKLEKEIFSLPSLKGLPRNNHQLNEKVKTLNNDLFHKLPVEYQYRWVNTSKNKIDPPVQKSDDSDKAMQYIWSTNAGYQAIQNGSKPAPGDVINEINRVSPGFFDGKKNIQSKIRYFDGDVSDELNKYILKCRTKNNDYYRGVSKTESDKLRHCARMKQVYQPGRFLATTTNSNETKNFPSPDSYFETVIVTGKAAVINSAYAVSEREHLFSRDDKFRVDISSTNQIRLTQIL
ncbi:hypothetical protein KMW40_14490 [Enterobacter cloacae]|uniref:hypothetical protein n=1 Tax=Enterobacter cloacae TaxID=550 RepID=UPI0034A4839A